MMHGTTHPLLARSPSRRGAFTLTEMLVVMGIIVLIIAFALPAFRFMSGDRSTAAGHNVLAAALGTARADAIGLQKPKGIAIYREATSGRLAAALIEFKNPPEPWVANKYYVAGDYVTYTTNTYACLLPNTSQAGANDPTTAAGTYWRSVGTTAGALTTLFSSSPQLVLDVVGDSERVLLPTGIDCRGIGNSTTVGGTTYRYFNPTVILFDGNGLLSAKPFEILSGSALATQIDANSPVPSFQTSGALSIYGNVGTPNVMNSQLGFVLFDDETFKTANLAAGDAQDTWFDQNAVPQMLNRFNGTLLRSE